MSAAVAAGKRRVENGYEVKEVSQELDFINLMTWILKTNLKYNNSILIWLKNTILKLI